MHRVVKGRGGEGGYEEEGQLWIATIAIETMQPFF